MLRSALLGLVVLAPLALCACPSATHAATGSPPCDISSKIFLLSPGFSPVDFGSCRTAKQCADRHILGPQANGSPPAQYSTPIVDAFGIAPPWFQNMLCSLDAIYIDNWNTNTDPNKSLAWGMRERASKPDANGSQPTHIGISTEIIDDLRSSSTPYAFYESEVLTYLLLAPISPWGQKPAAAAQSFVGTVTFAANPDPYPNTNDPEVIAVLGVLAHEMGHVVWWKYDVGDYHDSNRALFSSFSFRNNTFPHGYHVFGKEDQNNPVISPPSIRDVRYDLQYGNASQATSQAAADLLKIYGGEWASLFATVSLDEDFVETFKLAVLTNLCNTGPLQNLWITIPGSQKLDIIQKIFCNSGVRANAKEQWMAYFVKNPPPVK